MKKNPNVDLYFTDGCGRCPLMSTPQCKVHSWDKELAALRQLVLDCGLAEERKWGVPCYTLNDKNVVLINAFKDYCALSFFKGALLKDPEGWLSKPGENTQAGRLIRFTSVQEISEKAANLKAYIQEAMAVEQAGLRVAFKETLDPIPEELLKKFKEAPEVKAAFEALTPGRQRSYLIHFAAAKQSQTRIARIEKSLPKIFSGKGFNER